MNTAMKTILFSIGKTSNKNKLLPFILAIKNKGYVFYATEGTYAYLTSHGVASTFVYKPSQKSKKPNVSDLFEQHVFDLVINIPTHPQKNTYLSTDGLYIRGKALETGVTLITDMDSAQKVLGYFVEHEIPAKTKNSEAIDETVKKYRHLLHPGFSTPTSTWTYNISKSYDWNFEHGPQFAGEFPKREVAATKQFLSFKVNSLFGVPAGPLINSHWIELYAKLGFDILTYKTLRTRSYPAFSMPHMLYVEPKPGQKNGQQYIGRPYAAKYEALAMTNSFGVPSKDPDVWQEDLQRALRVIGKGQLLITSVMGTREVAKNEQEFIDDYAKCAMLAVEAGAPVIEINLSCPNLHGTGIICYDVALVEKICHQVKNAIGNIPLIAKIGFYADEHSLRDFVSRTNKYLDGISVINTIRGDITDVQMKKPVMRHIESSGICGQLIRPYGLTMVEHLAKLRKEWGLKFSIIGVGGVTTPDDYEDYIMAGADAVQSATGAMMDPYLAQKIYQKEVAQKQDYSLIKSLGSANFQTILGDSKVSDFKKIYLDMLYPKMSDRRKTLLVDEKSFKLKHGEEGRTESHIYLNHRIPLLSDPWDRKFLAKLLDAVIREKILPPGTKTYGVIAIPSSSSPELTAAMLDLFPESVSRVVLTPSHILSGERGAHTDIYGEIDESKPWVLVDDVLTSGKTFVSSLNHIKELLGKKYSSVHFYGVTLTARNQQAIDSFKKITGHDMYHVVSLDDILQYHWDKFSLPHQRFIKQERKGF